MARPPSTTVGRGFIPRRGDGASAIDHRRAGVHPPPPVTRSLLQELRHLVPERAGLGVRLLAGEGREAFEELLLLLGEVRRRLDRDAHVLVAALAAAQGRDALAAQPEDLTRLRTGRDLHRHRAVEGGHVDLGAERRLRKADGHLADDLGLLAPEDRVLAHLHHDVQVAGGGAGLRCWLALAGELEAGPGVDARRHLHLDLGLLPRHAGAAATGALLEHHPPGTAAVVAGAADGEEALLQPDLPGAAAGRARARLGAGLRARALARLAAVRARDADAGVRPEGCFLERDLEVVAQVRAARPPPRPAPAPEHLAEDVAEDVVDGGAGGAAGEATLKRV